MTVLGPGPGEILAQHEKQHSRLPSSQEPAATKNSWPFEGLFKIHFTRKRVDWPEAGRGEPAGAGRSRPIRPQAWRMEPISSLQQPPHSHSQSLSQSVSHSSPAAHHSRETERQMHTHAQRRLQHMRAYRENVATTSSL